MKTLSKFMGVILLTALLFNSCQTGKQKEVKEQKEPNATISQSISPTTYEKLSLPKSFVPKYKVLKEEDLSYSGIKRKQYRISVPSSLDKNELNNNIIYLVLKYYKKYHLNGISILVYEDGDNIESAYTVAMGEFAPYGDWGKIKKNVPLNSYKLKINYNKDYFELHK